MDPRTLRRSRRDRWIAGVCGGLGEYFAVDPTPIRLGFIVLSLWNGFGVLVYLVALLLMPEEPPLHAATDPVLPQEHAAPDDPQAQRYRVLGVILLLGGIYLLLQNLELFTPGGERLLAVLLIVAGFIILALRPGRI
jgi:phage shock protein C